MVLGDRFDVSGTEAIEPAVADVGDVGTPVFSE